MPWQIILLIVVSVIVAILYVINHIWTVDALNEVRKDRNEAKERIQDLLTEIAELKRFPKPSDKSRLDAALSEIENLKSRLRIAEATARDATDKARHASNLRDDRQYFLDRCRELQDENTKLQEEIRAAKQKNQRPIKVYSDAETEDKINSFKKQLDKKEETIKSLKHDLKETQYMLEDAQDDLEDCYEAIDKLNKASNTPSLDQNEYTSIIKEAIPRVAALPFAQVPNDFEDSIKSGRLNNAFKSHLMIIDKINMEAKIQSDNDTYYTTLRSCSCPDRKNRGVVCKHMLFLSYTSGLLLLNKDVTLQLQNK